MKPALLFCLFLLYCCCAGAQKSLFVTYNVEQGLGQSQATGLAQDSFHNLWISHLGGVSRFDGKRFTTYTTADGLQSNFCNTVLVDKTQNVWIGTHTGLSVFNGRAFKNFPLQTAGRSLVVASALCDRHNRVWALAEGEVYEANINQCKKAVLPFGGKGVLAIGLDALGELMVAIEDEGIFGRKEAGWQLLHPFDFLNTDGLKVRRLYTGASGTLYVVTNKGVYANKQNRWSLLSFGPTAQVQAINVLEDEDQRLWVATTKGVFRFTSNGVTHFDTQKGFTDHTVYSILKDVEGNFWFSTIGSGIIRYTDSRVLYFDKEVLGHIGVNGITKAPDGATWFGTYGGGLRRYDGLTLQAYHVPDKQPAAQIINFCLADRAGGIWAGTQGGGLWYLKDGVFQEMKPRPAIDNKAFYAGHINNAGQTVFATHQGVYEYAGGKLQLIGRERSFANTAAYIGADSILVGTPQGVYLLYKKNKAPFSANSQLARATVLSILRHANYVLIGTADKGLFVVSLATGATQQFDLGSGLSSNCIYAIAVDPQNRIWLSTGHYLNHFKLKEPGGIQQLVKIGKSKGMLSPEGNTNSLLITDTLVWAGNLNGLNLLSLTEDTRVPAPLKVLVTDVRLFSASITAGTYNDSMRRFYPVPDGLKLPHNKNRLSFSFHAVSLTDPDDVLYQYRIKGIDADFSAPTSNDQVVYSSLPPGKHLLQVKAVSTQGGQSPVTEYAFIITPPFYRLWYFQVLFMLLAFGLAAFLFHLRVRWKEKLKRKEEALQKEQQKLVRRRTAEDFHDDIGNKLTRINVLTEVLKNKVQVNEHTRSLIDQIQENTSGLYSSSKDLIWSLSNDEGSLQDLYARLVHFGNSLFQNTEIVFEYSDSEEHFQRCQVEPETSRNVLLMVKEAMNNALKHSGATRVALQLLLKQGQATITITDNGRGFTPSASTAKGYGLDNMQSRARRIGGTFNVGTRKEGGTIIFIQFNLSKVQ